MDQGKRARRGTRTFVPAALALFTMINATRESQAGDLESIKAPAGVSSREAINHVASMASAAKYLDERSLAWTRERKCGSCHTNYPYLIARPVLNEHGSAAMSEVRRFFEERANHWDDKVKDAKPKWDAEVVSTAAALALNDASTSGKLAPVTRKALDRIWTVQKGDGGFNWLKCDWPPYEHDDYFGAIVAALGSGHAPDQYAQSPTARSGLKRLRLFFASNPPPDLHHATMLLWASTKLDGIMSAEQRSKTISRLRTIQRPDGGWNLASLGDWKRRDGSDNDPAGPSDGYGTGLVVFILRQAGVPSSDPAIKRGADWLRSNQRESGGWYTRSVSNDRFHFIANAGTAFAVLALKSCDPRAGVPERHASTSSARP